MEGRFVQEWTDHTTVHPVGLAVLLCAAIAIQLLPRRHVLFPIIFMCCFVAPAQRVVIFTLDFNFLRLMVVFGWLRLVARGEIRRLVLGPLDWAIIVWAACSSAVFVVQQGTFGSFVNRLGNGFDALGMYFLFRMLVQGWADVDAIVRAFIFLSVPVAAAFLLEMATARNVFAAFGGVPDVTVEREGRLRCQGAFAHSILAGCFWAAQMPLFATKWLRGGMDRVAATVGIVCSGVIIMACASSTPVLAVALAMAGFALFPLRLHMRVVRWGLLASVVALHLMMNKPVWHLLGRLNMVSGSTGYHRFLLVDAAIHHFGEWWLVGTKSTENWGPGLFDVTNQYLLEGVRGGIWGMALFFILIAYAFGRVGRMVRTYHNDRYHAVTSWALGVTLVTHCANFIAISYFGQIIMIWYLLLAIVGSLSAEGRVRLPVGAPVSRPRPRRFREVAIPGGAEAVMGTNPSASA